MFWSGRQTAKGYLQTGQPPLSPDPHGNSCPQLPPWIGLGVPRLKKEGWGEGGGNFSRPGLPSGPGETQTRQPLGAQGLLQCPQG